MEIIRKLIMDDDVTMSVKFKVVNKLPKLTLMHKAEKGSTIGITKLNDKCFKDEAPVFSIKGYCKKALYYQTLRMVDRQAFEASEQCEVKYIAVLQRIMEKDTPEKKMINNEKELL